MVASPETDLTEQFLTFYEKYCREDIVHLAQRYPNDQRSLFVKISEDIYNRYGTDEARVREVWHFTTQMHSYSAEIEETPRMPTETLVMGGGDCEDTAILAASMLKAMPEDWTVEFVYMDADQPTNPENVDHVLIYVDTGEYQTFIETTSSTTMSPYSSIDGYYVEV